MSSFYKRFIPDNLYNISVFSASIISYSLYYTYFKTDYFNNSSKNFEAKKKNMMIKKYNYPLSQETENNLKNIIDKTHPKSILGNNYSFDKKRILTVNEEISTQLVEASYQLHSMCLEVVERVVSDDALLELFEIPDEVRDLVKTSWRNKQRDLIGRFDFVYDSKSNNVKLCEYNADTPTNLIESSFIQEMLKKDLIGKSNENNSSESISSFNFLEKSLLYSWYNILSKDINLNKKILFCACTLNTEEYYQTLYMKNIVDIVSKELENNSFKSIDSIDKFTQKTIFTNKVKENKTSNTYLSDINNLSHSDLNRRIISSNNSSFYPDYIWKLYPLEYMAKENLSEVFINNSSIKLLEPAWKLVLSSKALLPFLWEMYPNHPYLLPAYFVNPKNLDNEQAKKDIKNYYKWIAKPKYGREGEGVKSYYLSENIDKNCNLLSLDEEVNRRKYEKHNSEKDKIITRLDKIQSSFLTNGSDSLTLENEELNNSLLDLVLKEIKGKDILQAYADQEYVHVFYPTLSTWVVSGLPVCLSSRISSFSISDNKASFVSINHSDIKNKINYICTKSENQFRELLYDEDKLNNIDRVFGDSSKLIDKTIINDSSEYYQKYYTREKSISECHCGGSCPSYKRSKNVSDSKAEEKKIKHGRTKLNTSSRLNSIGKSKIGIKNGRLGASSSRSG